MFRSALGAVLRNWTALFWFEVPYQIFGLSFVYPFLADLLRLAQRSAGIPYLSQENLPLLLKSPLALLLLLAALLLFTWHVFFETAALVFCCEGGWRRERVSVLQVWREGLLRSLRLFRGNNLLAAAGILPLAALSVFRAASSVLQSFRVPGFLLDFILADNMLSLACAGALVLIHLFLFESCFAPLTVILEGGRFGEAGRASAQLLRGKRAPSAAGLALCLLLSAGLALAVAAVAVLLLAGYAKMVSDPGGERYLFRLCYMAWRDIGRVVLHILSAAVFLSVLVGLYHRLRGEPRPAAREKRRAPVWRRAAGLAAAAASFPILVIFSETEAAGRLILPQTPSTGIIAHRAGAAYAPENTLAALRRAIADGADMAEIDVRQLADGVLIVLHDSSFKRTTGVDRSVRESGSGILRELDAGGWFSPRFAGEPVPTLEEMLLAAKGRIGLMIELKPTGNDPGMEERTVGLIREHRMQEHCIVASMNLGVLRRVRQLDPAIRTVYISSLFLSDRYDLPEADGYSVETGSLSLGLVVNAHMQGRRVYGWTANSGPAIQKIIACGADGIVTDDPVLARSYLKGNRANLVLDLLSDLLFGAPGGESG